MSSFNRKFRRNQAKKMQAMNDMLEFNTQFCTKCNTQRTKFEYKDLPEPEQKVFEDVPEDKVDYYLYCPNCNKYSVIFKNGMI